MKKIILTAAILLGSLSTFAQATEQATTSNTEQAQATQEKYTEIKAEELPAEVTAALKKTYPTAILEKAYVNDKKEYKLEVKVDEKAGTLYADATGNWIKK